MTRGMGGVHSSDSIFGSFVETYRQVRSPHTAMDDLTRQLMTFVMLAIRLGREQETGRREGMSCRESFRCTAGQNGSAYRGTTCEQNHNCSAISGTNVLVPTNFNKTSRSSQSSCDNLDEALRDFAHIRNSFKSSSQAFAASIEPP